MQEKFFFLICIFILSSCASDKKDIPPIETVTTDSLQVTDTMPTAPKILTADDIILKKEFLYDKYTLDDEYPYKDTTRVFQWEQIKKALAQLEMIQQEKPYWGILQNRQNKNGEAPVARNFKRNKYKLVTDSLGTERFQSIPLYLPDDTVIPERYALDGSLVRISNDTTNLIKVSTVYFEGDWLVPSKYIKPINIDTLAYFRKVIFVDRTNQNITTLEKVDSTWLIRSMNPATTGVYRPPYAHPTPLGIFVIQEKKSKMIFLKDGSSETGGFAPYASRFSNGGYIHGIPSNVPRKTITEYSQTLGTIPRSHMCVRNASSHAEFVFDWAPIYESLVFVIE
ncbi:MAG: L,D-transpeptidase [Tannerella sp.]|jgi:lipoprotein-anchoring transpeptidase ErfK/SrfK|nr:L,D-transpeptidase [Tannerella sp.]